MVHPIPARQLRPLFERVLVLVRAQDLDELLEGAASAAKELTKARYAAVGVWQREDPSRLARFVTAGIDEPTARRIGAPPRGRGLLGTVTRATTDEGVLAVPSIADHPDHVGFPPNHPPMERFLGATISVRGTAYGTIYVTDRLDGAPFDAIDASVLHALASAVAAVVDSLEARAALADALLTSDRLRIARDLHDDVIQRLFGVGLTIQAALHDPNTDTARQHLEQALDDLDETIQRLRTTIFDLEQARRNSVRGEILDLVEHLTGASGIEHTVVFEGPVDLGIPRALQPHVVAATRELVANAVRHAKPRHLEVRLEASATAVRLVVTDDGVGFDPTTAVAGHGLRNLAARASELGGGFRVDHRSPSGSIAVFWLPVPTTLGERNEP